MAKKKQKIKFVFIQNEQESKPENTLVITSGKQNYSKADNYWDKNEVVLMKYGDENEDVDILGD